MVESLVWCAFFLLLGGVHAALKLPAATVSTPPSLEAALFFAVGLDSLQRDGVFGEGGLDRYRVVEIGELRIVSCCI